MRDGDLVVVALLGLVGDGEQHQRHALGARLVLPMRLDGGDLGRLVFQRVEPVLVADEGLDRRHDGDQPDGHAHHGAGVLRVAPGMDVARADRQHDEGGGEVAGRHHMGEAIGEARVEDRRQPVGRVGDAVDHLVAGRRLHPAIGGEDPEGGKRGADRHHHAGEDVQPARHPVPAEQHDAEEGRLQEEGGQHLVADQRPDDVADHMREAAPVGAELVGEHDARHHAHGEGHGEDLGEEPRDAVVALMPGGDPQHFQRRDIGREADGEAREDDVEGDGKGELDARQKDGIEFHRTPLCHSPLTVGDARQSTPAFVTME